MRKTICSSALIVLFAAGFADGHSNFGKMQPQIAQLPESDLREMIQQRQIEIEAIKEHWKAKINAFEDREFLQKFYPIFQTGTLVAAEHGSGSTYFLLDDNQIPQFVIKPFDEDVLCLNNPKHLGSPYNNLAFRLRAHIPLYRTAQAEALASAFAEILGLEHLTPKVHLAVLKHSQFFDNEKRAVEKLCSIRPYLTGIENLRLLAEEWLQQNLSEEEILNLIDQTDFENLFLLIWLFYDTDAHAGNFFAKRDAAGVYHLIKLDNGLTFPDKNSDLFNALYLLPQAKRPLSKQAIERIQTLPFSALAMQFTVFEMEDALEAFLERVELLKALTSEKTYTLQEIDIQLRNHCF